MAEEDSAEVCAGFDENVVLAVKNCFHDCDMRFIFLRIKAGCLDLCREFNIEKKKTLKRVQRYCKWIISIPV